MCKRRFAVISLATGWLCVPAGASYQGLQLEPHTLVNTASGPKIVWRLYATFSEPTDQLSSWGGTPAFPATISSRICPADTPGSNFFQAGGSNTAPSQKVIDSLPDSRWDTFATIGVSVAEQGVPSDLTNLSPGFPTFISGNQWTSSNAGVSVPSGSAQARADFAGDGDPALRVLMAQLTTPFKNNNLVTIGVLNWRNGAGQLIQHNNQQAGFTFTPYVVCCQNNTCTMVLPFQCSGIDLHCDGECTECSTPCSGDIAPGKGDQQVNIDDLLAVINEWNALGGPADVNGNGVVDIDDLLMVINNWGVCF